MTKLWLAVALLGCDGTSGLTSSDCAQQGSTAHCCREQMDCQSGNQNFGQCEVPGGFLGCGACRLVTSTCASDAECQTQDPTTICDPVACACEPANECVAGCTAATACGDGRSCDLATHRCSPTPCGGDAECPANFRCNGTCARTACTDDGACDGYCVEGACYATAGVCSFPPP